MAEQGGEAGEAEAGIGVAAIAIEPAPAGLHLKVLALHRAHAGEQFHQVGVGGGQGAVADLQVALDQGRAEEVEADQQWHHQEGDQGEGGADEEEHHEHQQAEGEVEAGAQHLIHHKAADRIELVDVV